MAAVVGGWRRRVATAAPTSTAITQICDPDAITHHRCDLVQVALLQRSAP